MMTLVIQVGRTHSFTTQPTSEPPRTRDTHISISQSSGCSHKIEQDLRTFPHAHLGPPETIPNQTQQLCLARISCTHIQGRGKRGSLWRTLHMFWRNLWKKYQKDSWSCVLNFFEKISRNAQTKFWKRIFKGISVKIPRGIAEDSLKRLKIFSEKSKTKYLESHPKERFWGNESCIL